MGKELFRHTIGIQDEIINDLREDNERLREDNEVLRGESQRLRDAVQDVLDFARGGDYGEIICNVEDFAALEKLIEETERGGE